MSKMVYARSFEWVDWRSRDESCEFTAIIVAKQLWEGRVLDNQIKKKTEDEMN